MDSDAPTTLVEHFSILEDTRDARKRRHVLIDMLIIAITAVICGALLAATRPGSVFG